MANTAEVLNRKRQKKSVVSKKTDKVFLNGENIYLRALERDDLRGDYRFWINDPEITRHMAAGTYPLTDDDLTAYYEENLNSRTSVLFAVIEKERSRHIGNARIYGINWVSRKGYRGVMIGDKNSWGKGYGLEAIRLISKYAFDYLNLNKLISTTLTGNIGIHKVNERAGYKREGEIRQEFFRDGRYHDLIYWGLVRSDYDGK